jgi:hypothetical protein
VVGDALVEDVVGGGQDLVSGRHCGFGVSAAALDAVVAGAEVGALGAYDRGLDPVPVDTSGRFFS